MKRIDMLEKICEYFYKKGFVFKNKEVNLYQYPNLEDAAELLKVIEEAGMKPPIVKHCPVMLRNEYVWEVENDCE